jgi:hypothetical protein
MALTALEQVRNKTTIDTAKLTDEMIRELLAANDDVIDLAVADALEYIASKQEYTSVTRGGISVSGPTAFDRSKYYRARGERAVADAAAGDAIQIGKMTRTDLGESESVEYA